MDAALLAKASGRPVRVQYTRAQATGWDPKGPASIHRARAAIDAADNVIAYEFVSKGFSRWDVERNGSAPADTLAGQLRGIALKSGDGFNVRGSPGHPERGTGAARFGLPSGSRGIPGVG